MPGDSAHLARPPAGGRVDTEIESRASALEGVAAEPHPAGAAAEPHTATSGSGAPPRRVVHVADAVAWLSEHRPLAEASLITSLPDVSGLPGLTVEAYRAWFVAAAALVLEATPPEGVSIFYQTDIKVDGHWLDKGHLCQLAAERVGVPLLWHRIVCRRPAGEPVFGRPGYTHLLCFSRTVIDRATPGYPDVLPQTGEMVWSQAMGRAACLLACRYVQTHTTTRTVVDPFCGQGSVLAVANELGLDAVGVELSAKRARRARKLTF